MSLIAALYSPSILYSRDEKCWQLKSPKKFTIRTGYFWDAKNWLIGLSDKPFSKILWGFSVDCLNVPIKRLQLLFDFSLNATSDNPRYETKIFDPEIHKQINVLGQVKCHWREI